MLPKRKKQKRYQPRRYTTPEGVLVYEEILNQGGALVRLSRHPETGEAMLGVGRDETILTGARLDADQARHLRNALSVHLYHVEHGGEVGTVPTGRPWKNTPRPPLPPELETLLRARIDNDLTQADVARLSGYAFTVQQLSKWERSQVQPGYEAQLAWRKALEGYLPQNGEEKL